MSAPTYECECGEETNNPERICRDCSIARDLDSMQCSVCERMRYRTDLKVAAEFGQYLWGEPCTCDPKPPTLLEVKTRAVR